MKWYAEHICVPSASEPCSHFRDSQHRPVFPGLDIKGTLHIVGGKVKLVPESPTGPSGKGTPTSAGASSKTSSAFFESVPKSTPDSASRPFPTPASTVGSSVTSRSVFVKRQADSEAHTSRPSKMRRVDDVRPTPEAMTKYMHQRRFERWFASWTAAHRAYRAPRSRFFATEEDEDEEGGEEPKMDWWRVEMMRRQGGVCYQTPDAFFAALGDALARHRHSATGEKENDGQRGKEIGGVLTFFGGYSIVAQPNILAMARLDKVAARMEEMGFR